MSTRDLGQLSTEELSRIALDALEDAVIVWDTRAAEVTFANRAARQAGLVNERALAEPLARRLRSREQSAGGLFERDRLQWWLDIKHLSTGELVLVCTPCGPVEDDEMTSPTPFPTKRDPSTSACLSREEVHAVVSALFPRLQSQVAGLETTCACCEARCVLAAAAVLLGTSEVWCAEAGLAPWQIASLVREFIELGRGASRRAQKTAS